MAAPEIKTLGRYTIERILGKGAMGVVYEGYDPRLSRRVAIKTILKAHLDENTAKDYSERFVREAQAVARLNHPNIVQVHDFGEEAEVAYLVLEFIQGKELKSFFDANERFDIKEAVRIMCELCDALEFAHNAGIIHRDVKPGNVMLDSHGRVKLTDFGVARIQDVTRTHATAAGTMVGTPAYMSPEQISGGVVDRRSDVFSAGIILYQFLAGDMPFTGSGAWTIAKKIMQDQPPLPSSLNTSVTPLFDAVVNKALAKNPAQRYQSARDLELALKRALEGKPDEDDSEKTVVASMSDSAAAKPAMPSPPAAAPAARAGATGTQPGGNAEVELEFWRAIKDGNDPDDFELYVKQFPTGIYAALAKRKIGKLRGLDTGTRPPVKDAQREILEAQARAEEEEEAKRQTAAKAKREAEQKAAAEAERMARVRAEENARREVQAKAKAEAEAKAIGRARAQAERATAATAERETPPPPTRSSTPAAVWMAAGLAAVAVIGGAAYFLLTQPPTPPTATQATQVVPQKRDAQQPLKPSPPEQKTAEDKAAAEKLAAQKAESEKAAREKAQAEEAAKLAVEKKATEQAASETRAKAEKELAERRAAEKATLDKAEAARMAAAKAAAEKELAARAAAAKVAAQKAAAEKAAAERAAAEKAAAERAAAEKAAADRVAAERAAAERAAAERAAAEKAAAAKLAEAREQQQWESVKNSTNPRDLDRYLAAYPNGRYAQLARTIQAKLISDIQLREQQAKLEEERRRMREDALRREAEARAKEEALARQRKEQEQKQKAIFVPPSF